jgi:hypothetical protein
MWDQVFKFLGDNAGTIVSAGASALGGYLSGQGASAAGDATASAANATTALNREIYNDQRALSLPGYYTGGAAANKLAAMYGIAPQNYQQAAMGGGNALASGNGLLPNLGAGQPVAGHTGGGGSNQAAQIAGSIAGSFLPIPFGSEIGAAIGGLVRNGGDNWTTVATQAPGGFDYTTYLQQPDLAAEWAKPDIKALFGNNPDAYANWHYNQFGKNEGRTLNPTTGTSTGTGTGTDTTFGGMTQGGTQTAYDPMSDFMGSMENRLATQMSDVGFGKIKGQLGAAGKSISGAGEKRYANEFIKNRYGAFGDYKNGLQSIAGMNQTATNALNSAGSTYGTNMNNSITNAGIAKGNALAGAYKGYGDGVAGALGELKNIKWG